MLRRWAWFRDSSWIKRLVAVSMLLLASTVVLLIFASIVDFPDDYNAAQSATAEWLAARPGRWSNWRTTSTRDLLMFVPAYVVSGTGALVWAIPSRAHRRWSCSFLVGVGVADVVETVLFRGSLDHLLQGGVAADLATRTTVTQVATGMKLASLVLVGVTLAAVVTGRGGRRA